MSPRSPSATASAGSVAASTTSSDTQARGTTLLPILASPALAALASRAGGESSTFDHYRGPERKESKARPTIASGLSSGTAAAAARAAAAPLQRRGYTAAAATALTGISKTTFGSRG